MESMKPTDTTQDIVRSDSKLYENQMRELVIENEQLKNE